MILLGILVACGRTPPFRSEAKLIVVYPAHREIPELWAFLDEVGQKDFGPKLLKGNSHGNDGRVVADIRAVLLTGTIEIRVAAQTSASSLDVTQFLSEALITRAKNLANGRFEVRMLDEPRLISGSR